MSGGENKKFMKMKSAYLDSTLILWRESQALKTKGIYEFDLQRVSAAIADEGGKKVQGCELIPMSARSKGDSKHSHPIRAYYLPYQPDQAFHHRLVDDVDYCFTPTLNGCTFVVGSGKTPLISHYNYVDDPKAENPKIDQTKIDEHIDQRYKHGVATIKREDYKDGPALDYRVTVVGFREADGWHFHYQRRALDLKETKGKRSELVTIASNMRVQLT
jgi:hypothetical protein